MFEDVNKEKLENLSPEQLVAFTQTLETIKTDVDRALSVLSGVDVGKMSKNHSARRKASSVGSKTMEGDNQVIEGVFDGQQMIGPDGSKYAVPANYASKSKLVEGDMLKLTITPDGSFVFKQIGPIERDRLSGVLLQDEEENYKVVANGMSYRIITASVTYFRGEPGDKAIILVPKNHQSTWAALENVIKGIANEDGLLEEADHFQMEADDAHSILNI